MAGCKTDSLCTLPPLKSYYFILLPNDIGSSKQNFVAITLNQKSYNKKFLIAQCAVSINEGATFNNFLLFITRLLCRSCGILHVYWACCNLVCKILRTNTTDCISQKQTNIFKCQTLLKRFGFFKLCI